MTTEESGEPCVCCGFWFATRSQMVEVSPIAGREPVTMCRFCGHLLWAADNLTGNTSAHLTEMLGGHISWCANTILAAVNAMAPAPASQAPWRPEVDEPGPWHPVTVADDGSYKLHCLLMDNYHNGQRCTLAARIQALEDGGQDLLRIGVIQQARFAGGLCDAWLVQVQEWVQKGDTFGDNSAWRTVGYWG